MHASESYPVTVRKGGRTLQTPMEMGVFGHGFRSPVDITAATTRIALSRTFQRFRTPGCRGQSSFKSIALLARSLKR